MAGGSVRKKNIVRNLRLEYGHDRLIDMKMIQVYQILVPDKIWIKEDSQQRGTQRHATSRDICEGVLGPSKRRSHY
jgi:hypothetical protein